MRAGLPAPQYRVDYDNFKQYLKPAYARQLEATFSGDPASRPVGGSIDSSLFRAPVTKIAGIRTAEARVLKRLGIETVGDFKSTDLTFADPLRQIPENMRLLFQTLAAAAKGAGPAGTVPFGDGNAAAQFLPALQRASEYARGLSRTYTGLRIEGGDRVRSMTPTVQAIQLQKIILERSRGADVVLGEVLPEKDHMRTIKTEDTIYAEIKALIDAYRR